MQLGHAGGAERLHEADEYERLVRYERRHEHELLERQLVGANVEHLALDEQHLHQRPAQIAQRKLHELSEKRLSIAYL